MAKTKFSLAYKDEALAALVGNADHTTVAAWAIDCAERVAPYFASLYPADHRPQNALAACRAWIQTGEFRMAVIRKASLDAHAAARAVGADTAARSAARAAGQAAAAAHVPAHAIAAANYALQARQRAATASDADAAIANERKWQYHHLLELTTGGEV